METSEINFADAIFEETHEVVKSILNGSNGCIFAYGSTGSGRSFTLQGTGVEKGIHILCTKRHPHFMYKGLFSSFLELLCFNSENKTSFHCIKHMLLQNHMCLLI